MNDVFTIYEAKTNFSKLVKAAKAGTPVYIGSYGKEEVMLVPAAPRKNKLKLGIWKDRPIGYKDADIVGSDPEIVKMFEDSKVMPDGSF